TSAPCPALPARPSPAGPARPAQPRPSPERQRPAARTAAPSSSDQHGSRLLLRGLLSRASGTALRGDHVAEGVGVTGVVGDRRTQTAEPVGFGVQLAQVLVTGHWVH